MDTAAVCSSISPNSMPQPICSEAASHNMQTVWVNSLNKQEDNRHVWLLWLTTQLDAWVCYFDCEFDSGAGCNVMPLYIYGSMFGNKKPKPCTVFINGYVDSPVKNHVSCTAIHLTECQEPQKAVFQVTDTRGYLIEGCELA